MEKTWFQKGENTDPPISKSTSNTSRPMASLVKARARPPTEKWSLHTSGGPGFFPELVLFTVKIGFPNWKGGQFLGERFFLEHIYGEPRDNMCVKSLECVTFQNIKPLSS